jgi:hypothetical protein
LDNRLGFAFGIKNLSLFLRLSSRSNWPLQVAARPNVARACSWSDNPSRLMSASMLLTWVGCAMSVNKKCKSEGLFVVKIPQPVKETGRSQWGMVLLLLTHPIVQLGIQINPVTWINRLPMWGILQLTWDQVF